jgi:hypothetical protein
VVEDSSPDAEISVRELKRAAMEFDWRCVETEADLVRAFEEFAPIIVLSDFDAQFRRPVGARDRAPDRPDVPFIFVSGTIGEETAIQSLAQRRQRLHSQDQPVPPAHGGAARAEGRRRAAPSGWKPRRRCACATVPSKRA